MALFLFTAAIGVGQPVTRLPPHRPLRAELPHKVPQNYSLRRSALTEQCGFAVLRSEVCLACPVRHDRDAFRDSVQCLRSCRPRLQTPVFGRLKYSRVCLRGWLLTCRLNFDQAGLSFKMITRRVTLSNFTGLRPIPTIRIYLGTTNDGLGCLIQMIRQADGLF